MLVSRFGDLDLAKIIAEPKNFHPFPKYGERAEWDALNVDSKERWIKNAEKFLDYAWPAFTMEKSILVKRSGDSFTHWQFFAERRTILGVLWMAECIEGKGRFLDQVMNGVIVLCEETSWMQLHVTGEDGYDLPCPEDCLVDLASSETASLLAWIYYTLKEPLDGISKRICSRIEREVLNRVIKPYVEYDKYWWMGFMKDRINNWNPWCNLNVIACYLLIDFGAKERAVGLARAMQSLDRYIETYSPDGCCDEGPCYWGAAGSSFFMCLELLYQASGGVIDIFDEQIVKDIGSYIYKVHISDNYYVNYADGDVFIFNPADVYCYGRRIGDTKLMDLGATVEKMPLRTDKPWTWFPPFKHLTDLFTEAERKERSAKPPYVRDAWFYNTEVMTAREEEGVDNGLFLSAKGGNNLESHNHNDVGNFIVFVDGKPLIIDLGTEEYCAQTFSKDRFELWYLQSQYHNCPTVNDVLQHDGGRYKAEGVAYESSGDKAYIEMDIAPAYPENSDISKWKRNVSLYRGSNAYIEITDSYTINTSTDNIRFNFMFACEPLTEVIGNKNVLRFAYDNGKMAVMEYDAENLSVVTEAITLKDSRLQANWGKTVYRVILKEKKALTQAERKVRIYKYS